MFSSAGELNTTLRVKRDEIVAELLWYAEGYENNYK